MTCFEELKRSIAAYFSLCRNHYTLLHYLADLFKLFILLNYVYFAYMIFAQLFQLINKYFEKKKCPKPEPYSQYRVDMGKRDREFYNRNQSRCTCMRPSEEDIGQSCERPRSPTKCPAPNPGSVSSLCNLLFSKKSKPASSPCNEKPIEPLAPCGSSFERIQVEFNCKPKRPKKTKDGRVPKCRSCTKCGKSLAEPKASKQCNSRMPMTCRRRRVCNESDNDDEFEVRRWLIGDNMHLLEKVRFWQ